MFSSDINDYLKKKHQFLSFLKSFNTFVFHNFIYSFFVNLIIEGEIISRSSKVIAAIFFSGLIISWLVYFLFSVLSRNYNWINRYFDSLELINNKTDDYKNNNLSYRGGRGREPFLGVSSIIEHPNLMLPHELKDFYGWNARNDFFVQISNSSSKKGYLKLTKHDSLWVGSDAINVTVPCGKCDKDDALIVYCLAVNDGTIYRQKNAGNYLLSFPLKSSHLTEMGKYHVLNNRFRKEIETLTGCSNINIGILSLFQKNNKNGMLVLVSIKQSVTDAMEIGLNKNSSIAKYIIKRNSSDDFECIEAYAILTYMLSTGKRIGFAKDFYTAVKREYKIIQHKQNKDSDNNILIDVNKEQNSFKSRLIVFKNDIVKFIRESLMGDTSSKVFAIFSYVLFSVLLPYFEQTDGKFDLTGIIDLNRNRIIYILICFVIVILYISVNHFYKYIHINSDYSWKKLPERILTNYITLPDDNKKRLLEPIDYQNINITYVDEIYGDYDELDEFKSKRLRTEKNDGNKYRLIDYEQTKEGYNLVVDLCHYTQCKALHLIGDADNNNKKDSDERFPKNKKISDAKKLYSTFNNNAISFSNNKKFDDVATLPPNNLCLHLIVVTNDGKVLITRRDKNLSYESDKLDFSIEEQLSSKDFCHDGKIIDVWAKRALEEELGLNRYNALRDDYFDIDITSLFLEGLYLNFSMCGIVELNISSRRLKAILDGWPRSDYEFDYQIVSIAQLCDYVKRIKKECGKDKEKLKKWVNTWHSSAFNRMYQFSIYYGLKDFREVCDSIIEMVD